MVLSEVGTLHMWPWSCHTTHPGPLQASTFWDSPESLEFLLPYPRPLVPMTRGEGSNGRRVCVGWEWCGIGLIKRLDPLLEHLAEWFTILFLLGSVLLLLK